MSRTQTGQHANRGLDDVVECLHLARLANAGFEDAHTRVLVEQPHRQRHTDLRIVATRRTCHLLRGQEQLVEPLLDPGLTVRARDTHDGNAKLVAMAFGQSLQSSQRRGYFQEVGLRIALCESLRNLLYDKAANATTIEFIDIPMPVVALGAQGKKQSLFGETK